jgi:hypothetical protein
MTASLPCPFCDATNPPQARFCNACGSRLHLKLCEQCQAVNDQEVANCYQCGARFSQAGSTSEAAARAACQRLQEILQSGGRALAAPTREPEHEPDVAIELAAERVSDSPEGDADPEPREAAPGTWARDGDQRQRRSLVPVVIAVTASIVAAAYFVLVHPDDAPGKENARQPASATDSGPRPIASEAPASADAAVSRIGGLGEAAVREALGLPSGEAKGPDNAAAARKAPGPPARDATLSTPGSVGAVAAGDPSTVPSTVAGRTGPRAASADGDLSAGPRTKTGSGASPLPTPSAPTDAAAATQPGPVGCSEAVAAAGLCDTSKGNGRSR